MNNIANLLKNNGVVIIGTDTVPTLSAKVSKENLVRINKIKKSSFDKPLSIFFSSKKDAINFIDFDKGLINDIFDKYLPGRNTLIFKTNNLFKETFDLPFSTIGIRIVTDENINNILKEVGPIFTTSVNISGDEPLIDRDEIKTFFDNDVDYVDEIITSKSNPTNIFSFVSGKEVKIR